MVGDTGEKKSMTLKEISDKFAAMVEGNLNILVDLNKSGLPSAGARKEGLKGFEGERIGKVGFFGLHPVAKIIASFVIGVSKKKDMRFFRTKEEALKWLKE